MPINFFISFRMVGISSTTRKLQTSYFKVHICKSDRLIGCRCIGFRRDHQQILVVNSPCHSRYLLLVQVMPTSKLLQCLFDFTQCAAKT